MAVVASLDVLLNAVTRKFDSRMAASGKAVVGLKTAVTALGGAFAGGALFAEALRSTREFQKSMAESTAIMGDLNAGDRVDFSLDMVRDWSFTSERGLLFGNYTTRVMVPHLDQSTAEQLRAVLSPAPVPNDWK